MAHDTKGEGAFAFSGDWREFAPIAFTNLLLSVVTLGLYLFWARTRERRYLWSQTRFIDDQLEYTGTGLELFIGYVLAVVLFGLPFSAINFFALDAAVMRGHEGLGALIGLGLYLLILYLTGVAIFRALRYRLSRTLWHGIRGGSDNQGLGFGFGYLWKTIVGSLALGLLIPWSMTSLWNQRFNQMSFGPHRFDATARANAIFLKFLLFYLSPFILVVVVIAGLMAVGIFGAGTGGFHGGATPTPQSLQAIVILAAVAFYLLFFIVLGVIALTYYAAYFREVVGKLALGGLEFAFTARTRDWIALFLGNFALIVCTLGIGYIFVGYRNWSFFIRHMQAFGTLDLDDFTQSQTRAPGTGEGLLDAFDVGAF